MELTELRDLVTSKLVSIASVPLIPKNYQEIFVRGLVERAWSNIPARIRNAIADTTAYVDGEELARLSETLLTRLRVIVRQYVAWFPAEEQENIAVGVHQCLMAMAAEGCSAQQFPQVTPATETTPAPSETPPAGE